MEGILVDILILAVFCITVGISTYRGFIKSAVGVAVIICSFIAAKMFGGFVGEWIDGVFMFDLVDKAFTSIIMNTLGELSGSVDISALFADIPEGVLRIIEMVGVNLESIEESIASKLVTESNVGEISAAMAAPISSFVSAVLGYLGVFIVGLIVFKLAGSLVTGIFKLPILNAVDKFLGFVIGTVTGALLSWGFAVVFRTAMGLLAINNPELLPFVETEGTFIYEFLVNFSL